MFPLLKLGRVVVLSGLLVGVASLSPQSISGAQQAAPQCEPAVPVARVPELPEGSGLTASRLMPGRFWSLNDSNEPVLIALDSGGRVVGRLQISGATVDDWEAIAVGPCAAGSCIYVADIGDNDARRREIAIYRIAEPAEPEGVAKVTDVLRATYPDGAHDAEAMFITADGRLYIVTKGDTGPVSLYRVPSEHAGTVRLERIGAPRSKEANDKITDGAVSPDGRWIVLRSKQALMFHRAADLLAGNWREAARVPLASLGEPQGEGVTFGSDNAIYLMSEGANRKQPGMIARLTCRLNP